ncbi:hypothetical protein [Clostridium estertheticum]|uniref:hypothetical protein n=1 Tax=Clostridium estertheticum TaxID=238834 RepID=UPI001C7E17F7|nr:hypothetical protein [Clostridium estertheticum]MBX4271454.1 hypothetical protein [Clostridium estertheticum]WLC81007.1 hypothetical protein KTC98_07225 [Clostridium estertheticum]
MGEESVYNSFLFWSKRAWNEFNASSIIQRLENEERKVETLIEQMGSINEDYFTVEEAERLKDRLEELERMLHEHIEVSGVDEDKKKEEIMRLSKDIEFLTINLTCLNKSNWFNGFFTRFNPMKLSGEKRKILLKFGGKALGLLIEDKTGDSTIKEFIDKIAN